MCGGASLGPRHDVIAFENLRLNTMNLRFQNSPPFSKLPGYVWPGSQNRGAKYLRSQVLLL